MTEFEKPSFSVGPKGPARYWPRCLAQYGDEPTSQTCPKTCQLDLGHRGPHGQMPEEDVS